jgi:hypothetical protein
MQSKFSQNQEQRQVFSRQMPADVANPLTILGGSLVRWHNASQLSSLWADSARTTRADSDKATVGSWDNLAGSAGHLLQATESLQLGLELNEYGPYHALLGDGVDDFLMDATYNEAAHETWWLAVEIDALGSVGVGQGIVGTSARVFFEQGSDNQYEMYAGATFDTNVALPGSYTRKVLKVTWNGAGSALAVNGTQVATGNPGAGAGTNVTIGICGGQPLGAVKYYELAFMTGSPSAAQDQAMTEYFRKYNPQ